MGWRWTTQQVQTGGEGGGYATQPTQAMSDDGNYVLYPGVGIFPNRPGVGAPPADLVAQGGGEPVKTWQDHEQFIQSQGGANESDLFNTLIAMGLTGAGIGAAGGFAGLFGGGAGGAGAGGIGAEGWLGGDIAGGAGGLGGAGTGMVGAGAGGAGAVGAGTGGLGGTLGGAGAGMVGTGAGATGTGVLGGVAGAAGTAITRILDGTATAEDYATVFGKVAGAGVGLYGAMDNSATLRELSKAQIDAQTANSAADRAAAQARYDDLVRRENERYTQMTAAEKSRYDDLVSRETGRFNELKTREDAAIARQRGDIDFARGLGAPSRDRYEASYAPGFDITKEPALAMAQDSTLDALLRRLSTESNPFGNPGGLTQVNKDVLSGVALPYLQSYRTLNANTGGLSNFGASGATIPGIGTGLPTGATAGSGTSIYSGNPSTGAGTPIPTGGASGPNQFDVLEAQNDQSLWKMLGSTVGDIFNPPKNNYSDLLKLLRT